MKLALKTAIAASTLACAALLSFSWSEQNVRLKRQTQQPTLSEPRSRLKPLHCTL